MPRGSLSFLARPGGLLVPVGCLVLSVWPRGAFLSSPVCLALEGYPVLSGVFSPGGLLIPPDYPREILWGGGGGRRKGSGCRGGAEETEAKAPKTICHGLLSSQLRHGRQSSLHHHGPCLSVLRKVPVLCSYLCLS